ncbi:hypothetical protein EOM09_05230, partial [bacterium]|nr:hypothetical protein [bacterium]
MTENKDKPFLSNYKLWILLILIFVLAFAIRGHLLKYDYMFEFDTYWHLRATGYIVQGDLPDVDPLGFYKQESSAYTRRPQFLWYFTAALYALFTLGASYDKWLLMSFARLLPAIFGALISFSMYFLGKEIYNRKAGFVMGVISATIPAFVYRTMAGFFEEDALGFLWLVWGFIFLVKALKNMHSTKKHLTNGLISAVFFALMSFTWDMFILIPLVLVFYFIANTIYMAYKNSSNSEIASFVKIFLIIFIVFFSLASLYQGTGWVKKTTNYVTDYLPVSSENIDRINKQTINSSDVVGATVGEENTGKQFFLLKYNFSVWIPFVVLVLMIFYLLFNPKKDYFTLLLFFWIAITLFMAWSKLKFTYTLGIPIAAATGFLYYFLENYVIKKNSILLKRIFVIFISIIILSSIAAGSHFVSTKVPHITTENDWRNSLFWINENTSQDAKFLNWWDYGHWLTYFGERKASTDNTNSSIEGDSDFAMLTITTDNNTIKHILTEYDAEYYIADNSYFSRFYSFGMYAYITTNYQDPRISKYLTHSSDCQTGSINNEIVYKCGEQMIKKEEYDKISTKWTDKPTT